MRLGILGGNAILEMSSKGFGCVGIVCADNKKLLGIITDGDLRRCLSGNILGRESRDIMTRNPITISNQMIVSSAISLMNNKKITSLFICESKKPLGIVHIHDLLRLTS